MKKQAKGIMLYDYSWHLSDDALFEQWENWKSDACAEEHCSIVYEDDTMFVTSKGKTYTMEQCEEQLYNDDYAYYKDVLYYVKNAVEKEHKFRYYVIECKSTTHLGEKTDRKIVNDLGGLREMFRGYDVTLYTRGNKLIAELAHSDGMHTLEFKGVPKQYPYISKAQGLGRLITTEL